jgi:pimeloyl-ACP methyl ester carboxylesterase
MFMGTSHGALAYEEYGKGGTVVLFIHGNSSCRKVFKRQMTSEFYEQYRMITFDLPGHGESENSPHPHQTYTLPGFADATQELIEALRLQRPVVAAWSLGGHIAIELLSRHLPLQALLLIGAPPVGKMNGMSDISQGFKKSPTGTTAGTEGCIYPDRSDKRCRGPHSQPGLLRLSSLPGPLGWKSTSLAGHGPCSFLAGCENLQCSAREVSC